MSWWSSSAAEAGAAGGEGGQRAAGGAAAPRSDNPRGDSAMIMVQVCAPDGDKQSLKVRRSDDAATLRALVTQMYDSADWTQVNDRREDRAEYSDVFDEDTGFAEVIALQANPQGESQGYMDRFSGRPRTWLEWRDKRGKLRLMCGAYILEDGNPLSYYHIADGSVIHPLYERFGDTLDASAAMLIDPTWYKQQYEQAKSLAAEVRTWEWKLDTSAMPSASAWSNAMPSAADYMPAWPSVYASSSSGPAHLSQAQGAREDDQL